MYSPSKFSCSGVPLCQIAAVMEKFWIFFMFVSGTALDGHRQKMIFFVIGESQDGNPDCDFNPVLEEETLSTAPQKKAGGLQLKDNHCWHTCPLLIGSIQFIKKKKKLKPSSFYSLL